MTLKTSRREWHASQRLEERYGVALTDDLKRDICRKIRRAKQQLTQRDRLQREGDFYRSAPGAYLIGRTGGREIWSVLVDEISFRVVYAEASRTIVTFLPPIDQASRRTARR